MNRVLILCTGNSCRSQMAEYFLRSLDPAVSVSSAGTHPAARVHPLAVTVMEEIGIPMNDAVPKDVATFVQQEFDYLVTVCDSAREECPVFTGRVRNRLHIPFDDPARAAGSPEHILQVFRRVRDEIRQQFGELHRTRLSARSGTPDIQE